MRFTDAETGLSRLSSHYVGHGLRGPSARRHPVRRTRERRPVRGDVLRDLDGRELTLTYTLETAVEADESATVCTPGDEAFEHVVVQPDTYDFEADDRETVRFTAIDEDGEEILLVYAFAQAEDADENQVDLAVDASS